MISILRLEGLTGRKSSQTFPSTPPSSLSPLTAPSPAHPLPSLPQFVCNKLQSCLIRVWTQAGPIGFRSISGLGLGQARAYIFSKTLSLGPVRSPKNHFGSGSGRGRTQPGSSSST